MKWLVIAAIVALVLLGCLGSIDIPVALILGWIGFLANVVPRITVYWPSLLVGAIAVLLFAGGVHLAGRGWSRRLPAEQSVPWRARWSAALIVSVFLLFTAGITLVGIAHQLIWLFSSERPILVAGAPFGLASNQTTINNMKQTALAVHSFADIYRELPVGVLSPEGKRLHGWETRLLPFIPYSIQGIDMKRPWNDPANEEYFKCIIPEFINSGFARPQLVDADGYGLNHFSANTHVLGPDRQVQKITDFRDGTSNTLLFGEISTHFRPWAIRRSASAGTRTASADRRQMARCSHWPMARCASSTIASASTPCAH